MGGRISLSLKLLATLHLCASAIILSASIASADLKLVSTVTVTGGKRGAQSQKTTTCYKGDMVRTETERTISLFDAKAQTVITVNKEDKTYRVLSLKSAFAAAPGMLSRLTFKTTAEMTPQEETAVIAGFPARKYLGKATFAMSMTGVPGSTPNETTMEIEQWATEAIAVPAGALQMTNPFLRLAGPLRNMKGMEPLMNAMAEVKGTPLSNKFTITTGGPAGAANGPVVTTNVVESVSTDPLDPALFRVPKGFTKAEARPIPAPPAQLRSRGAAQKGGHAHP